MKIRRDLGINIPDDRNELINQDTCAVYSSATLKPATGLPYAVATATAQNGDAPGRAQITVPSKPTCS